MTMRILMTSEAEDGVVSSLLVAAHQLLNKPVGPTELLEAVQSASRLRFLLMNERFANGRAPHGTSARGTECVSGTDPGVAR